VTAEFSAASALELASIVRAVVVIVRRRSRRRRPVLGAVEGEEVFCNSEIIAPLVSHDCIRNVFLNVLRTSLGAVCGCGWFDKEHVVITLADDFTANGRGPRTHAWIKGAISRYNLMYATVL
jgi:hypothetical protein